MILDRCWPRKAAVNPSRITVGGVANASHEILTLASSLSRTSRRCSNRFGQGSEPGERSGDPATCDSVGGLIGAKTGSRGDEVANKRAAGLKLPDGRLHDITTG